MPRQARNLQILPFQSGLRPVRAGSLLVTARGVRHRQWSSRTIPTNSTPCWYSPAQELDPRTDCPRNLPPIRLAALLGSTLQATASLIFVAMVPSTRLAPRSFASMRRSGPSLPIAIHFMGCSALARWDLCPENPARKS